MFDEIQRAVFKSNIAKIEDIHSKEELCDFSCANLDNIQKIVGNEIDFSKNVDLLSVAFPITVVNQINENGEALISPIATEVIDYFKHKPTNIEHKPQKVVGHMIDVSFNEMETYDILKPKDIKKRKDPFYLSASAVLYKLGNPNFIDLIKRSSDPEDSMYQAISASWEIIFKYYAIAVGSKNIEECEIYTEPKDILKYKKYLKKFGGSGKLRDGTPVGRIILGPALPVGIGFTTNPAANVKGISVNIGEEDLIELVDKKTLLSIDGEEIESIFNTAKSDSCKEENKELLQFFDKPEKNISHNNKNTVNNNKSKNMELEKQIKLLSSELDKFKDAFKTDKAEETKANLIKVVESTLKEKNQEWVEKIEAEKSARENEKAERQKLSDTVDSLKETIDSLKTEKAQANQEALVTSRMDEILEKYELSTAAKKQVLNQIKQIGESDEDFENYKKDTLEVIFASFDKEAIENAKEERIEAIKVEAKKLVEAETEKIKAAAEKVSGLTFEEILSKASEEGTDLPNSQRVEEEGDLVDKIVSNLKSENVNVK